MQGRVTIEDIPSEALAGNLPGDPDTRRTPVYLPPSYDRDSGCCFPTVYVLAGFTGTGQSFLNYSCWQPTFPERLDALITQNKCPEVIAVMPDCMTRWGGSQYVNSTAIGRYQDHVAEEVPAYIDHHFRTVAHRDARAIVGKSSGGYGAIVLGLQRSDIFGAVGCHAGDMYFEYCYLPDIPKAASAVQAQGGLQPWLEHFEKAHKKKSADFAAMNVLAMAAAYSPHPDAPLGLDLPFDADTGELREEVWLRWLEHDPIRLLETHHNALTTLRALFIDVGSHDEYNLHLGARILHRRLQERSIPHIYEEFPDGHRDTAYRYERSIPLLAKSLEGDS